MAKRIARLLPNGRLVLWGLSRIDGRVTAVIGAGEVDTVRVELNEWLDTGETVAASALADQSGVTITKTNNATSVDLSVSDVISCGRSDLTVTTSTGRKRVLPMAFMLPGGADAYDAYRDAEW